MTQYEGRNRKLPRLRGYDYAQEGAYFITICTYERNHLFGDVIQGEMRLNQLGQIAESCWMNIPEHFQHAQLDLSVIMPNHVHGIVLIVDTPTTHELVGKRHAFSSSPSNGTKPKPVQPGSLGAIIGSYKSAVTRQINRTMGIKAPIIWQVSYHDHIIRNERELNFIRQYVLTNPSRWAEDVFYRDLGNPI